MPTCACQLKPKGQDLGLLKSASNAENFTCTLSWTISSHFVAIHSKNVRSSQKLRKIHQNPFSGFKVTNVDKSKKTVTSASYDEQHVSTYLQQLSH